jgi:ribonucleoside-diphosphate reductase alpha chain
MSDSVQDSIFISNLTDDLYDILIHIQDPIYMDTKKVNVSLKDATGKVIFELNDVVAPISWSDDAVRIAAEKFFRKGKNPETSVFQMVNRIVSYITAQALKQHYIEEDKTKVFSKLLERLLLGQYFSFNSPVWFNVGIQEPSPRISACYIVGIEDTMESILDTGSLIGMIYKYGSGSGINYSPLRGKGEKLSGGGSSSGVLPFIKAHDTIGGSIKSGGKTRRAAHLAVLNVDHPDILDFINCKTLEEKKVKILIEGGLSSDFADENGAYASVAYQNANHSVRVTNDFMQAVKKDENWKLISPHTGKVVSTLKARKVFDKIAEAAWISGDPGLQFDTEINLWNTLKQEGRINGSNPCQPAEAPLLTPNGIVTIGDIAIGDTIWSGKEWTKVVNKVSTGIKEVYKYRTTSGFFIGTKNHKIFESGKRQEVGLAQGIDIAIGHKNLENISYDSQTVMDGLVLGDGGLKKSNKNKWIVPLLYIGEKDQSYFDKSSGISEFFIHKPFDKKAFRVTTTLTNDEIPKTFDRRIPKRFLQAKPYVLCSFLRGLYSANGSICDGRVTFKTSSKGLVEDIQIALSSLGISTYFTTNKAHYVKFLNGTYTCKESYDINITKDRKLFANLIGFIQPYKTQKMFDLIKETRLDVRANKITHDIIEREFLGEKPVYDITVACSDHSYWTSGSLVSNCSEFHAVDNTACNLASINLLKFLTDDSNFTYFINWELFWKASQFIAVCLDVLIDNASFPSDTITKNVRNYRQIGLGFANFGALVMREGLAYDSFEACHLASLLASTMTNGAYTASAKVAKQLGPFGAYEKNKESMLDIIQKHLLAADTYNTDYNSWIDLTDLIDRYGLRNSMVTVIAPTGTIGLQMDCDTFGVEPDIALIKYKRLIGGGTVKYINKSVPYALKRLGYDDAAIKNMVAEIENKGSLEASLFLDKKHLPVFDTALKPFGGERSINWQAHINMLSAIQPFISGSISKTVNMSNNATVEDIKSAYMMAWEKGLKCIALYRDGCKQSQPLNTTKDGGKKESTIQYVERIKLPDNRQALTHKFSVQGHEGYITVGLYPDGHPGEVFINVSKEGSTVSGLLDAFATMTSIALQHGAPLDSIVDKLKGASYEPQGMTSNPKIRFAKSFSDYLARFLEINYLKKELTPVIEPVKIKTDYKPTGNVCSICDGTLVQSGTCEVCTNCGATSGCS